MVDETVTTPTESTTTTNDSSALGAVLGDGVGDKAAPPEPVGDTPPKVEDKPAAPEKYEAWTVPEGYELDAGLVEEATPIFKELGLTQEQSQRLVDFYAKHSLKAGEDAIRAWQDQRQEWREGLKSDEVLGKLVDKTGNFSPESPLVQTVNRALQGLQNPKLVSDFKAAMDMTGAGDNPAFVRVLYALASKVTEGTSYAAGGPVNSGGKRPSAGAALYPNLPSAAG